MKPRTYLYFGLLLAVLAVAGPAFAGNVLGELLSDEVRVDGVQRDAGDLVEGPAVITTASTGGVLALGNGRMLRLAANSAVRLSSGEADSVEMQVLAGRTFFSGTAGRIVSAGTGSLIRLDVAERGEAGMFLDDRDPDDVGGSRATRELRQRAGR